MLGHSDFSNDDEQAVGKIFLCDMPESTRSTCSMESSSDGCLVFGQNYDQGGQS